MKMTFLFFQQGSTITLVCPQGKLLMHTLIQSIRYQLRFLKIHVYGIKERWFSGLVNFVLYMELLIPYQSRYSE